MKLREVEYWINKRDGRIVERKTFIGRFHTWGQRSDGDLSEFFGVVESKNGECLELDAEQITFIVAEEENKMFISLGVWYEGDSNMVETFLALSVSRSRLRSNIIERVKKRNYGKGDPVIYDETLGETCPDDGSYGDKRRRFIIREVEAI